MHVYLDIETIPATMTEAEARAMVKVPGNIKKPETMARHIDSNWKKVVERTSLDPHRGSVFCAVVGTDQDDSVEVFRLDDSGCEETLLRQLGACLLRQRSKMADAEGAPTLVGWNSEGFDLPWLWRRAVLHGVSSLCEVIPHGVRGREGWRSLDLMAYWAGTNGYGSGRYVKMAEVCDFLSIDCPPNGSSVAGWYQAGELDKIVQHCCDDVLAMREVWNRVQLASLPF